MSWLPGQDDFRNFCMSEETEKVYQELKEIINAWNFFYYQLPYEKL